MTASESHKSGGPDQAPTHWPAPAKLNLFLHVTGRRPDGYHELQTLFQLIDLCGFWRHSVHECFDPFWNWNGSNVTALSNQVNNSPVIFSLLKVIHTGVDEFGSVRNNLCLRLLFETD
jgi:hypothetical protein